MVNKIWMGLTLLLMVVCLTHVSAQTTGGGTPNGDGFTFQNQSGNGLTTNTGQTATQTGTTGTSAGANAGTQTGNVNTAAQSGSVDPTNAVNLTTSEDTRNQGFVGATAPGIQTLGYVGANSENSGPPLVSGASFGGGVNTTGGGGAVGRGGGAAAGLQGQGFGGATTQNGFTITRQSVRGRLVPSFSSRTVAGEQVANQFVAGFNRLPLSQNIGGQYQVSVHDRTAFISGYVPTKAASDQLERQLRLQPGVYKIENRLQVGQ